MGGKNDEVKRKSVRAVAKYSPNSILIMVTNPLYYHVAFFLQGERRRGKKKREGGKGLGLDAARMAVVETVVRVGLKLPSFCPW